MSDLTAPRAVQAERALLGSIFKGGTAFDRVTPIVLPEHFFDDRNRVVFEAMVRMSGVGIDLLTVAENLRQQGVLEKAGGVVYVAGLVDGVPDVANAHRYAEQIRDAAIRRRLIADCRRIEVAASNGMPVSDLAAEAVETFTLLSAARDAGPVPANRLMDAAVERINDRITHRRRMSGLSSGFPVLDAATFGIQRGVGSLAGARTRVGKTALALNIARNVIVEGGRVLMFEMDMSPAMISDRLVAMESGVDLTKIRTGCGYDRPREIDLVAAATGRIAEWRDRLQVDYTTRDVAKMVALARREKRANGLDLVIVDHIGHCRGGAGKERYLQVGDVSARLVELANATNAAVLSLVQLGRDAEERRPLLSDLRESGNLEQDARLVLLLDRPALRGEKDNESLLRHECELVLHVAKNEGEAGFDVTTHFNLSNQRITEQIDTPCVTCGLPRQAVRYA